ncbi:MULTISPECIES: hypothetical protein [unclassified Nocardia]|uniref:hypothetical protein n=1 Tax=unclassified Nocardia TaxID=2637762 RepID=UPI001CE3DFF5|nr:MULTISPECIES: hypothetical protein [unclassified Nocardia]
MINTDAKFVYILRTDHNHENCHGDEQIFDDEKRAVGAFVRWVRDAETAPTHVERDKDGLSVPNFRTKHSC